MASRTHLPVVGSGAASTSFVSATVDIGIGELVLDGNGKIARDNGTYADPKPNALSILSVDDCPGSTETCRASCYVQGLAKAQPELYEHYRRNSELLRELMDMGEPARRLAAAKLGNWIRANCTSFRWHVSGDVFSVNYARWIRDVTEWAGVPCWIYTRSLWAVPTLMEPANMSVLVSADRDNYTVAIPAARACGARVALLLDEVPGGLDGAVGEAMLIDLADGDVIFPDYPIRPRAYPDPKGAPLWNSLTSWERRMLCPVDSFGASAHVRCGPCKKCFNEV